jgi:hypothetical protein
MVTNTKTVLNPVKRNGCNFHKPFKDLTFNANVIGSQQELSKQLQELHTDVALLSETHLKPHQRLLLPKYHLYQTDHFPGRRGGIAIVVIEGPNEVLTETLSSGGISLMKWQFVCTHTIRHTEIPALLDSCVTNTSSVKMLHPHKNCLSLNVHPRTGHEGPEGE